MELQPGAAEFGPLKELHPKDIIPPAPYKGDTSTWLDWSARFRRYAVSRADRELGRFLEAIELQRGNPVTAADEAEWEKKFHQQGLARVHHGVGARHRVLCEGDRL